MPDRCVRPVGGDLPDGGPRYAQQVEPAVDGLHVEPRAQHVDGAAVAPAGPPLGREELPRAGVAFARVRLRPKEVADGLVGRGTVARSGRQDLDVTALALLGRHRTGLMHAAGQRQPPAPGREQQGHQRSKTPHAAPSGRNGNGLASKAPATRRGSVMRKAAPTPGSPHACNHPPCSRTSSSAMASPRPVPPVVRARDGSPRQNRVNTRPASPGLSPIPWSRTTIATDLASLATEISIGPPSACSMALTSRLRKTRSIRTWSASTRTGFDGSPDRSIVLPFFEERPATWSTTPRIMPTTSTSSVSSEAAPASYRLISSRSTSRSSKRSSSVWRSSADRAAAGS